MVLFKDKYFKCIISVVTVPNDNHMSVNYPEQLRPTFFKLVHQPRAHLPSATFLTLQRTIKIIAIKMSVTVVAYYHVILQQESQSE